MKIFVGNLSPSVTEDDLRQAFSSFGQVSSVNIVNGIFTGVSRGFGFVEMPSKVASLTAITSMNYRDLKGQVLKVGEARPPDRPRKRFVR